MQKTSLQQICTLINTREEKSFIIEIKTSNGKSMEETNEATKQSFEGKIKCSEGA